jgi:hypothetical protein
MSEAGSLIAEADNGGPSNRRRRLDGTILDFVALENLSVPFWLSPGGRGGSIPNGFHPPGGCDEAHLVGIFSGRQSGNLALGVL